MNSKLGDVLLGLAGRQPWGSSLVHLVFGPIPGSFWDRWLGWDPGAELLAGTPMGRAVPMGWRALVGMLERRRPAESPGPSCRDCRVFPGDNSLAEGDGDGVALVDGGGESSRLAVDPDFQGAALLGRIGKETETKNVVDDERTRL